MNKHEKPKTHKIGKIVLTGLTSLTIAGIGAGVACIVMTGGTSQEPTNVKTSTAKTSTSQSSTAQSSTTQSSSKEYTSEYNNHKTPGVPDYVTFDSDPVKFFSETCSDYTYDDSCPGYLPNNEKTVTNVAFTKFAAETYQTHYYGCQPTQWLIDSSITEPYELYDALCEHATHQWEGDAGWCAGYKPVVGDIIIFSDIKDFDNPDPTHYVSGVVCKSDYGWYVTMRTSLYNANCCGNAKQILMDIQKKLGTDYKYASVFTLDH